MSLGCNAMTIQQQYDELYLRVHKAIQWLDSDERTLDEVEKWMPQYEKLFDEWKRLERMIHDENARRRN